MSAHQNISQRLVVLAFLSICAFCSAISAQPNRSQARNAIRRMQSFDLTGSSVRVRTISPTGPTSADVSAEVRTVFRFEQDKDGRWRAAELRTAQDRWERVDLIASALNATVTPDNECATLDPPFRRSLAVDPSFKRARCLLGSLLGIDVPSDSLRIQEISPLAVPMSSQPSALVIAWVRIDARLTNDGRSWQAVAVRTAQNPWVELASILSTINARKQQEATTELEMIARALENYRTERGFYVVSDSQAVAIDHLSPRFLSRVIRVDPWNQPYKYQGERNHFTLRSSGPDTKEGTADDVVISRQSR